MIHLLSFCYYNFEKNDKTNNRTLKSGYKKYCEDVIKRKKLPLTFPDYVKQIINSKDN